MRRVGIVFKRKEKELVNVDPRKKPFSRKASLRFPLTDI
jgi:hypothetical protein